MSLFFFSLGRPKHGFSRSLFRTSSSDTDCILTLRLGLFVPTLRRFCRLRSTIWYDDDDKLWWYDHRQKSLMLRRSKSDRDEIWQDCSSSKYASFDGVGFSIWRHTFKMAAMTSFHAEKCCHLMSNHEASAGAYAASSVSSWSIVHSYLFHLPTFLLIKTRKLFTYTTAIVWARDWFYMDKTVFGQIKLLLWLKTRVQDALFVHITYIRSIRVDNFKLFKPLLA